MEKKMYINMETGSLKGSSGLQHTGLDNMTQDVVVVLCNLQPTASRPLGDEI